MEQGNLYTAIWNTSTNTYTGAVSNTTGAVNTPMVSTYICPGRRPAIALSSVGYGPRTDYTFTRNGQEDTGGVSGAHTILATKGVTMTTVTNLAGTSNTILMSHKIMKPGNYLSTNGEPNNGTSGVGWDTGICSYGGQDHMRYIDSGANGADNLHCGYCKDTNNVDENHYGGPHTSGSPVLYADDSVRMYSYRYVDPQFATNALQTTSPGSISGLSTAALTLPLRKPICVGLLGDKASGTQAAPTTVVGAATFFTSEGQRSRPKRDGPPQEQVARSTVLLAYGAVVTSERSKHQKSWKA